MSLDPVESNPDHYKVVFENDRVLYTLSSFRRRLVSGDAQREVEMEAGLTGWLPAQEHHGENIGDTPTHVLFVELKDGTSDAGHGELGPSSE